LTTFLLLLMSVVASLIFFTSSNFSSIGRFASSALHSSFARNNFDTSGYFFTLDFCIFAIAPPCEIVRSLAAADLHQDSVVQKTFLRGQNLLPFRYLML